MIKKLKDIRFTKRGIYISLAICMLLVGGIGVFTAVRNINKIIDDTDFLYEEVTNLPDSTLDTNFLDSIKDKEVSEPVINNEEYVVLNFISPVAGEVSKEYSGTELVYSETMNDYRTHTGVDFVTEEGTAVVSSESGEIVSIEKHPLWGTMVKVEHENGFTTCYKNLSDTLPEGIEIGSYVSAGGVIGSVGSTALVEIGELSHLHFEMAVNGTTVNPLEYIS